MNNDKHEFAAVPAAVPSAAPAAPAQACGVWLSEPVVLSFLTSQEKQIGMLAKMMTDMADRMAATSIEIAKLKK